MLTTRPQNPLVVVVVVVVVCFCITFAFLEFYYRLLAEALFFVGNTAGSVHLNVTHIRQAPTVCCNVKRTVTSHLCGVGRRVFKGDILTLGVASANRT
jgi:hypothetical protein